MRRRGLAPTDSWVAACDGVWRRAYSPGLDHMQVKEFRISIPAQELDDLRARIKLTRWPTEVREDGWKRGMPLSYTRQLAEYWSTTYDWRAEEERLNQVPQFVADVDGQPIHFVHARSSKPNAIPLLICHGYPSSFVEFSTMIEPLVSGDGYKQAFHVIVPSLPGFGFSTPVSSPGWEITRMANAFDRIMQQLGYAQYGVLGGDIGAGICEQLCIQAGKRVLGSLVTTDAGAIATEYTPPTDHLTDVEQERLKQLKAARREDFGYIQIQATRPRTISYSITDSPVGQLAWIVEKFKEWTDPAKELPEDAVDRNQLLTNVSVYWFGRGGAGAANFLYEAMHAAPAWGQTHDRPQGFAVFGRDPLVRRILDPDHKRAYWNEHARGGHFPGMEAPALLAGDLNAFFYCM
jgi:epoxide hydrolase